MNEWCKCNFCVNTNTKACCSCFDGSFYPGALVNFLASPDKVIEKSKTCGLSVADIISLIDFTGGF